MNTTILRTLAASAAFGAAATSVNAADYTWKASPVDANGESRAPISHRAKFRLGRFGAPTFPSGTFDAYLSVGKVDGTPVYELPIGGDDGQRRYKVGSIQFDSNR